MKRAITILIFLLLTLTIYLFEKETINEIYKKNFVYKKRLNVTATAYCSTKKETDDTPLLAAWGNRLDPDVQSIAISRDLFDYGLTNGKKIHIDGFKGEFTVLDVMNKKWKNKIDIYMGKDREKALEFGKHEVTIYW